MKTVEDYLSNGDILGKVFSGEIWKKQSEYVVFELLRRDSNSPNRQGMSEVTGLHVRLIENGENKGSWSLNVPNHLKDIYVRDAEKREMPN